ncbi:MAG: UbiD family decarboxylase [Thermincola sp.]|nr:UbiD family decarboxylase [Thermincola sp.]
MKYYKDNREYIAALEQQKDLVRIKDEIDWDLEAGAIVRKACEDGAPAPLIENIKDYPGYRYLGALVSSYPRLAIILGLDPKSSIPEIAAEYVRRTSGQPIKPKLVDKSQAPCKENILLGDDVDLFKLPAPMLHEGDGGRYLGTWHIIVAKDPENSDINWGMYRTMVYDSKTMVGLVMPISDMGKMFLREMCPQGQEFALCNGHRPDPISAIAACAPSPMPEDEFAGMMMGEPIELVKCETCDLEVPAHAEIIIEGELISGC